MSHHSCNEAWRQQLPRGGIEEEETGDGGGRTIGGHPGSQEGESGWRGVNAVVFMGGRKGCYTMGLVTNGGQVRCEGLACVGG